MLPHIMAKTRTLLMLIACVLLGNNAHAQYSGPFLLPRGIDFVDIGFFARGDKPENPVNYTLEINGDKKTTTFAVPFTQSDDSLLKAGTTVGTYFKFIKVAKNSQSFVIKKNGTQVLEGTLPAPSANPIFFCFGDTREANKFDKMIAADFKHAAGYRYIRADSQGLELYNYMANMMKMGIAPQFNLLIGDIVNFGGEVAEWDDFFKSTQPVLANTYSSSAWGNHEVQSIYSAAKGWQNYHLVPYLGNIFFFDKPEEKKLDYCTSVMTMYEQCKAFDIGPVRFIPIPIMSETEFWAFDPNWQQLYTDASPESAFNHMYENIKRMIDQAAKDRADGKIKFIITFSHAGLINTGFYQCDHDGIFYTGPKPNTMKYPDKAAKLKFLDSLEKLLLHNIDAHFNAHNHLYDRAMMLQTPEKVIPFVTIGLGTELDPTHLTNREADASIRYAYSWVEKEGTLPYQIVQRTHYDKLISNTNAHRKAEADLSLDEEGNRLLAVITNLDKAENDGFNQSALKQELEKLGAVSKIGQEVRSKDGDLIGFLVARVNDNKIECALIGKATETKETVYNILDYFEIKASTTITIKEIPKIKAKKPTGEKVKAAVKKIKGE